MMVALDSLIRPVEPLSLLLVKAVMEGCTTLQWMVVKSCTHGSWWGGGLRGKSRVGKKEFQFEEIYSLSPLQPNLT